MLKLRGTQKTFVDKSINVLMSKSTKKCIMVAPVAYGKSICIANTVIGLDAPCIVLQPNLELLIQNYTKYTSYGYKASVCSQSLKQFVKNKTPYTEINGEVKPCNEVSQVTYATIGTIKSMVDKVKEVGVKYMIIDECHFNTASSSQIRSFIERAKIKNILGVTATPVILTSTMEGSVLKMMSSARKNMFSTLSHVVQIQEMVDNDYWSDLVYDIKTVDSTHLEFNTSGSEYTKESMEMVYDENQIERKCVSAVGELREEGRKSILVYVPSVATAISLGKKIEGSAVVHGQLDKKRRASIIKGFKNQDIDVVINVEILTTGFDHPELDAIVMARPTASIALYYQIIGRITRIHDNKLNGRIVDLSGNVNKFGKVEDLNYEFIDGYGWGLFSNNKLLSNFPLSSRNNPTKDSLAHAASEQGLQEIKDHNTHKLWFGKYNGIELQFVPEHYLAYILDNFDFASKRMKQLKNSIEIKLKLKTND